MNPERQRRRKEDGGENVERLQGRAEAEQRGGSPTLGEKAERSRGVNPTQLWGAPVHGRIASLCQP